MLEVIVRPAERRDCPEIRRLKEELADHQNMTGTMLSYQELERDGFDTIPPCFQCIIAETKVPVTQATNDELNNPPSISNSTEEEYQVVGYALYFYAYAAWEGKVLHLEDLCTSKSFRGKSVGSLLLKELAKIGLKENCARIQLEVLNSNESGLKFYNKNGGIDTTAAEGWHNFKFDREAIRKLAS